MDASLAARLELEVLDRIGDVDGASIEAGFLHRPIHNLTRRADEGPTDDVFLIAWLFADKDHLGMRWPLAEHRLRCWLPEMAATTIRRLVHRLLQRSEIGRAHV